MPERYSPADASERGRKGGAKLLRLLGAAAHQWLTAEKRREEIEDNRTSAEEGVSRMKALAGIRVVDFSWVRAGPWATRWLGAFGAEIIKIEWPENERGRLPSTTTPQNLEVNLNTSGNFNDTNVNKKSLSLNVRSAKGLEIVKRLI